MIFLSKVEDSFTIQQRGCILVPGLPHPSDTIPVIKKNSEITLRRPDGSEIQTNIRDLEMISRRPSVPFTPILLPSSLTKEDVPIGTELWYAPKPDDIYNPA